VTTNSSTPPPMQRQGRSVSGNYNIFVQANGDGNHDRYQSAASNVTRAVSASVGTGKNATP
jgi:hypothetical protein